MSAAELSSGRRPVTQAAWLVLLFSGVAALCVTNESFWIDEFATWEFASTASLRECWQRMIDRRFPEIQAPFYMAYIWGWTHLFGTGEATVRAAGAPWFVAGAAFFTYVLGRHLRALPIVAAVLCASAFVCYYLNEARLYSTQLAFAFATVAAGAEIVRGAWQHGGPAAWAIRVFAIALVGLCGSNVLGALHGFVFFIAAMMLLGPARWGAAFKRAPITLCLTGSLLAGLAAYYAWTLTVKPQPTAVGTTTAQTLVFVIYELLGATGLGPGRSQLREQGASALKPFLLPLLAYFLLVGCVLLRGVAAVAGRTGKGRLIAAASILLLPAFLLVVVGVTTHFRLLGRHLTPLCPVLLAILCVGAAKLWHENRTRRSCVTGFLCLGLISCFSIRLADRHRKDDYRSASEVARAAAANGQAVWWSADSAGAKYYGLELSSAHSGVKTVINPTVDDLAQLPVPDVIVTSKPDVYDNGRALAQFIQERGYQLQHSFPAISVWKRQR